MSLACSRSLFFSVFLAGALVLGLSYYLEYSVGLKPCGLCLLQRICLATLTAVCLVAAVHGPARFGSCLYWLLGLCCCLAGTAAAWRQVLLQSEPMHPLSACPSNLTGLFANEPWVYVVKLMFDGGADCAQISWTLFGLSLPEWSLLFFVAMMIPGICQLLRLVWIAVQRPLSGESSHQALAGD